jgi:phosphonoacetate hydrolase
MKSRRKTVAVNGREYSWPKAPIVVICCDGSEPDYMEIAMAEGLMPNLKQMIAKGDFASFPVSPIQIICPS